MDRPGLLNKISESEGVHDIARTVHVQPCNGEQAPKNSSSKYRVMMKYYFLKTSTLLENYFFLILTQRYQHDQSNIFPKLSAFNAVESVFTEGWMNTKPKSEISQKKPKSIKQLKELVFGGAEDRRAEGKRFRGGREEKCIVFTVYSPIPSTFSNSPAYKSANTL